MFRSEKILYAIEYAERLNSCRNGEGEYVDDQKSRDYSFVSYERNKCNQLGSPQIKSLNTLHNQKAEGRVLMSRASQEPVR